MEAGLSEVKSELQSRDDLLRIIEMERLQLHRELTKIGECRSAQENKKGIFLYSAAWEKLLKVCLNIFKSFIFESRITSLLCISILIIRQY